MTTTYSYSCINSYLCNITFFFKRKVAVDTTAASVQTFTAGEKYTQNKKIIIGTISLKRKQHQMQSVTFFN